MNGIENVIRALAIPTLNTYGMTSAMYARAMTADPYAPPMASSTPGAVGATKIDRPTFTNTPAAVPIAAIAIPVSARNA